MQKIKSHTIFFGLAFTGILVLSIFIFLTKHQLSAETSAKVNVELFYHNQHNLTMANAILFVILLFVANFMFIRSRYWDTFIWTGIIFSAFTLIDWWWLSEMVFQYKIINNLSEGESNPYPIMGVLVSLMGLAIAIGNYYLLKRIFKERKSHPIANK